ncbi:MAG: cellulose synthase catalytic subunit [Lachnospiraceae bacterium]|nr:cellulose synthase catalytic subunit [Lachnospiraceae bacterium]
MVNSADNSKDRKNLILVLITTFFSIIYLIWRVLYTIPFEYGAVSVFAGVALLVVEILGLVESSVHHYNLYGVYRPVLPEIEDDEFPDVDIYISTYNEPEEVLIKTINGCKYMKYPDLNKVHIYLCDDGHRAKMKEFAKRMGINYLDRDNHDGAKAGNLNHAMSKTTSPYIVTFDADMIPRSNFLLRTIPYFIGMEKENIGKPEKEQTHLGFVQAPQAFYNPDLFQYYLYSEERIPNEQDYFYRDIQVSRNKSNCVIYGGSNTVLSRKALNDIGGFYTETITEDFATGMLIQKKGYKCIAIDEVLASGLSATDLKSLINQRVRWARGVITTNRKMHTMWSKDLTPAQKINYWASVWYWYAPVKRLIYYMCPILYGVFGYMVIKCTLGQILVFWLPMYITQTLSLRVMSHNLRTAKWTGIYETILFPFLLIPVLMETIGIKMKKFKVTKKGAVESEAGKNNIYITPFAFLVVLSIIGIYNCIKQIFDSNDLGPAVVLFWLVINLYSLVMAMFFVMGRNYVRKYDRMEIVMDALLHTPKSKYNCRTSDLSDEGLSLVYDKPINIDDSWPVVIGLKTEEYSCMLKCNLLHSETLVDKNKDTIYKYSFVVIDYLDTYEEYMQIIYDRVPPLPQHLKEHAGSFDDLKLNIVKRKERPVYQNRTSVRLKIEPIVYDYNGNEQKIVDFNYKYLTLKASYDPRDDEILAIAPEEGLFLVCRRRNKVKNGDSLYKVENYYDIVNDKKKNLLLEKWVESNIIKNGMITGKEENKDGNRKDPSKKGVRSEGLDEMSYIKH